MFMYSETTAMRLVIGLAILYLSSSAARATPTTIVFPRLLEERSDSGELLVAIRNDLTLTLRKASVFREKLEVTTFEDDKEVVHRMNGPRMEQDLYHDAELQASLLVTRDNGLKLVGILGDTERIQPLSSRMRQQDGTVGHEIKKIDSIVTGSTKDVDFSYGATHESSNNTDFGSLKRSSHQTIESRSGQSIYPLKVTLEVRICTDSTFSKAFKQKKQDIVQYFAVLMAFVNLKFRGFQSNILQLQHVVTGITIYDSRKEQEFVDRFEYDSHAILDSTLYKFNTFISKNNLFKNDDVVILFTGLDLSSIYDKTNPKLYKSVAGFAVLGGACGKSKAALIEDIPRIMGSVHTVAHEIGHLLGAHHDGSPLSHDSKSRINPMSCPAGKKHIMTPVMGRGQKPSFSYCSTVQVAEFVLSSDGGCLKTTTQRSTRPIKFKDVNKTSPSPEDFCKRNYPEIRGIHYYDVGESAPQWKLDKCVVTCKNPAFADRIMLDDAPDGMRCNNTRMICINGECTRLKQNPLTTFGNDTDVSFIRN